MSILITLLLNLLVSFLVKLLEQWLFPTNQWQAAEAFIALRKDEFLSMIRWRFWLGISRVERASKAFDLAMENFKNLKLGAELKSGGEVQIAQAAMTGIAEKL